ncbi:MAG: hypothetical protein IKU25_01720 [Clostridia bacterium]|nr:hypothetical protein [Clostridia bacterium]
MIKGVNRQIVEVNQTECDYFERIIFIVRPEYKGACSSVLKSEADKLSKSAIESIDSMPKTKKNRIIPFIKLLSAAGIGAAAMAVISHL